MQKRTGRPVHPLWAHFHRGEKRNRYHYHAYCVYCVARHGIDHVSPTRGVSTDLLRHLECCPDCPHNVVESIKQLCGLRERVSQVKKREIRGYEPANPPFSSNEDQVLLLQSVAAPSTNQSTLRGDAANGSERFVSEKGTESDSDSKNDLEMENASKMTAKRRRRESDNELEKDVLFRWKTSLLQMAVAANISLSAFQKREFQKLLLVLSPVRDINQNIISQVGSKAFLKETATRLACTQLDRMKEGTLNSTITSGLTLSISCWRTLRQQNLVAFTLVNSNGDAACVRVEELRRPSYACDNENDSMSSKSLRGVANLLPLADAIEDVLKDLEKKNICVVGIVADSTVALYASMRVCKNERWRSLLVIPCMSTLLSFLAGCVLTNERYCNTVGQLVEIAAYFSNSQLQTSLRLASGEKNARIPIPSRANWYSFITCVSTTLHYSDVITALCESRHQSDYPLAPLRLRELVLDNDCQLWKALRELLALLAPLREAYNFFFRPNCQLEDIGEIGVSTNFVNEGISLGHVMYQFGRMGQQYAALTESADRDSSISNNEDIAVVARQMYGALDTIWQRYDLPTMVLAYMFDFHLSSERLDTRNISLQWKAVSSYFHLNFHRWFCGASEIQSGATLIPSIPRDKVESLLNAYQLRQFPFDSDTTNCYQDVSSFYSFVSDSHPEVCALCCRLYAVALACADVRRVIRGIGFLPSVAQTTARPEYVELLLHVGFATNLKRTSPSGTKATSNNIFPDLLQTSRPAELLCSQDEWSLFASEWREELGSETAVDELERSYQDDKQPDKEGLVLRLSLNQLFNEALPPLAGVVKALPLELSKAVAQTSVAI
ncbi:putative ribonuclease H-like superfamily [Plasmopara halstedii]